MKKSILFLFVAISFNAFAQHPCDSLKGTIHISSRTCAVESDTLIALATGNDPFTYKWSFGGQTTDTIIIDTYDTLLIRSVTIKDSCGDSVVIPVIIKPETPILSACCNSNITLGDSILLVAAGDINNYQWSPAVHCIDPPLCDSVIATPSVTTIYTVSGTDSLGCPAKVELTITILYAGISSIDLNSSVNIYPNPSSSVFTFSLTTQSQVKICDVTGRLLFSEIESPGTITLGRELNPGIYFLFIDGNPAGKIVKL